jgi:predicted RNase H-like nuclease (RuvC/YqgF family)
MFDFETSVSGIEFKVRQLADEVASLRQLVSKKEDRCHELEEELKNSEKTINNLKEENKLLKLGNKLSEKGESADIKLKINQMIRAIDKSLELLKKDDGNSIGIG